MSVETEKASIEKRLSETISHQKEDLESLQWQLDQTVSEKDEQIVELRKRLVS